jgi:hypothetical protein
MPRTPKPKAPPGPLLPGFLIQLQGNAEWADWLDMVAAELRRHGVAIASRHALAEHAINYIAAKCGLPAPPPRARRGGRPRKDAG